jgi:hypothetical protein
VAKETIARADLEGRCGAHKPLSASLMRGWAEGSWHVTSCVVIEPLGAVIWGGGAVLNHKVPQLMHRERHFS